MIGVLVFGTPNSTPLSGCHGAFRLFMLNHIDSTRMVPMPSVMLRVYCEPAKVGHQVVWLCLLRPQFTELRQE